MKRIIGIIACVCAFVLQDAAAQRVTTATFGSEGKTFAVIDNSAMPAGCTFDGVVNPIHTSGRVIRHTITNAVNAKVSQKFAVTPKFIAADGTETILNNYIAWAAGAGWDATANNSLGPDTPSITGCGQYAGGGPELKGKWRLPTQRELMLMWSLEMPLISLGTSLFRPSGTSGIILLSASEAYPSGAEGVRFDDGVNSGFGKTSQYAMRCILDL